MESSILYKTNSIKFIKIFYYLLLAILVIFLLSTIFIKVNDTINISKGEVYSDNPKLNVYASNEGKILSVNINEGDVVKMGDTLIRIESSQILSELSQSAQEAKIAQAKLSLQHSLIKQLDKKKVSLKELIIVQEALFNTNVKIKREEIKNLKEKINFLEQQSLIISDNFKTDSILFSKGVISKIDLQKRKYKKIEFTKNNTELNKSLNNKILELHNTYNLFDKNNIDVRQKIIEIENKITNCENTILDLESMIEKNKINHDFLMEKFSLLQVTSPINGTVSNLFNSKQNSNIIEKGELLVTISPDREKFYVKANIPEKDLIYIKNKQKVILRVDAYNYYKYGPIIGEVNYISPTDIGGNFYCLIKIKNFSKNIKLKTGFKIKGKIILENIPLYDYFYKILFNKIDN